MLTRRDFCHAKVGTGAFFPHTGNKAPLTPIRPRDFSYASIRRGSVSGVQQPQPGDEAADAGGVVGVVGAVDPQQVRLLHSADL